MLQCISEKNIMAKDESTQPSVHFPPVVAVLGHVDHGKTSLLDAIRETSIAEREHGGITQKIGASEITINHEGAERSITFIDTPGHEAFAKMRSRGAQVADIGLLIVSAADGVKPQTRESINVLKNSGIPYIVVLTKVDLPTANVERVKQQLMVEGVLLEGLGGDVPVIDISSVTKYHIKELLELILLVQELHQSEHYEAPEGTLRAIVIESKLDQKAGPRATVVVKEGILKPRDEIVVEGKTCKIRSLMDDKGKQVQEAGIGKAVEVLGFTEVPTVGSVVTHKDAKGETPSTPAIQEKKEVSYQPHAEEGHIALILCADTYGSLEAITNALPEEAQIISQKTGEVSEADILMAKSTGALVIGFNIKLRPSVLKLARTEKVLLKNYTIIYELIDEIADVIEGKQLAMLETIYGSAQVLAKFPYEKTFALGIKVLEGRVAKGDKARIMRGEESIGETQIASLRIGKNPVSKVEAGLEAGIVINPLLDFQVGDVVLCHE